MPGPAGRLWRTRHPVRDAKATRMETIAPPIKETKAQKAERLKRQKNPWECLDEIRRFAREGFESVPPEWRAYFRWWGIYTQGDGLGVVGGKGGEGNEATRC